MDAVPAHHRLLAARLTAMLNVTHAALGVDPDPLLQPFSEDYEIHELSPCGVLAFLGDYVLAAWPDDEVRTAAPEAYRLMSKRLRERGHTKHMVHPLNFRSVRLTRRMGAKPVGVDEEGFVHYVLRSEDFPHHPRTRPEDSARGEKVSASQAA